MSTKTPIMATAHPAIKFRFRGSLKNNAPSTITSTGTNENMVWAMGAGIREMAHMLVIMPSTGPKAVPANR